MTVLEQKGGDWVDEKVGNGGKGVRCGSRKITLSIIFRGY